MPENTNSSDSQQSSSNNTQPPPETQSSNIPPPRPESREVKQDVGTNESNLFEKETKSNK